MTSLSVTGTTGLPKAFTLPTVSLLTLLICSPFRRESFPQIDNIVLPRSMPSWVSRTFYTLSACPGIDFFFVNSPDESAIEARRGPSGS